MPTVMLQPDSQDVVHEAIDGETLVINLASGNYYSLRGTAHEAWELLVRGSLDDAAAELARRYPGAADVDAQVRRFASELLEERLLVEQPDGGEPTGEDRPQPSPSGRAFEPPRLERYTDMQHFLLLDPVHEVDDAAGWPYPAAGVERGG